MMTDPKLNEYADLLADNATDRILRVRHPVDHHVRPERRRRLDRHRVAVAAEMLDLNHAEALLVVADLGIHEPVVAARRGRQVDGEPAELTVREARRVARPSNTGPYIPGWHQNYYDPARLASSYVKREQVEQ